MPGPRNNSWKACSACSHRSGAGDLGLCLQREQSDGPVRGGQGMGNVAAQRRHVAHLRTRDQVAGFDQRLGMCADQRVQSDVVDR